MFSTADRPVITPRRGESLTAATFRQLDRFHGSGLSATDQTVIISESAAVYREQLDAVLRLNAEMQYDRDSLRQALSQAHELIDALQEQLEAATANAASDADAGLMAAAWAFHVESH